MKAIWPAALAFVLSVVGPASAQTRTSAQPSATSRGLSSLSFRPFVMATEQQFAALTTFEAAFGSRSQPFFGGGLNITHKDRVYVELAASRFKKTGEQAFYDSGRTYRLGIPLTATITPFELTAGYRFHQKPRPRPNRRPAGPSRLIPYVGGGVGLYRFEQTSEFANPDENVDTKHAGAILEGGLEVRLQKYVGVGVGARYTHVPSILGSGGISEAANEKDLGGIAAVFRVVVGR